MQLPIPLHQMKKMSQVITGPLWRALYMAMGAGLIAVQANVQLQGPRRSPEER